MGGILLAGFATSLLCAAGVLASSRFLPSADRIERWVAGFVFAFVLLTSSTILLSFAGCVGRNGFLVSSVAVFVGSLFLVRRPTPQADVADELNVPISARVLVGLTTSAVGLASIMWLWNGIATPVLVVSDGPIYHLPFAARWLQDGTLSRTWTPFGELAATYFPGNGEIWMSWLLALVGDDRLAKVAQWFFLLPTFLALYALGRRVGDSASAFWPPLCWAAGSLALISSVKPDVDLPMTFLLTSGLVFVERGWNAQDAKGRRRWLIVAGLSFGAAIGTKSIGLLYSAAPLLLVFVLLRRDWKGGGSVIAATVVAGDFWFIRNAWETGNPLYPLRISLGGFVLFDGWYGAEVMRETSAYHAPIFQIAEAWDQFLSVVLQPTLWIALAFSLLISPLAFTRVVRAESRRAVALCVVMGVIWAAEYWFVQPYNTQQRFLLPALGAISVPLALLRGHLGIVPAVLIVYPTIKSLKPMASLDWRIATVVILVLGAAAVGTWRPRYWSRALSIALFGAVLLAPSISVPRATAPLPFFYSTNDFGQRLFPAWARLERSIQQTSSRCVVGYAGTNLPYFLACPDLKSRVRYVNIQGEADWLPHDHFNELRRRGTPRPADAAFPQWHRDQPSREAWLRNLDALGVDHFLVARENFHGRLDAPTGLPPFPIEYTWLVSMPDRFERLGPPAGPDGEEPWGIAFRVRRSAHRPN